MSASATYTKLRTGNWGIRVEGTAVTVGTSVTVRKASGETKVERVVAIVWQGNGITLCAIGASERHAARIGTYSTIGARNAERQRRTGWTGCQCGSIEGQPRKSDCFSCRHDAD